MEVAVGADLLTENSVRRRRHADGRCGLMGGSRRRSNGFMCSSSTPRSNSRYRNSSGGDLAAGIGTGFYGGLAGKQRRANPRRRRRIWFSRERGSSVER